MHLFLQEHGEALLYGITGTFIVFIICVFCTGKWKDIVPQTVEKVNKSNKEFNKNIQDKYPIIEADEIIYATYKDERFDYRDYIVAKDYDGSDITSNIKFYGEVDLYHRGVYKLKCVVKSASELISTKYVNIIVE